MKLETFIEATKEGRQCHLTFNFDGDHVKLLQSKVWWIGAKLTSDDRGGVKAASKAPELAKLAEKLDDDDDSDISSESGLNASDESMYVHVPILALQI